QRCCILDLYAESLEDADSRLPGRAELNLLFETAEVARCANRVVWPALAIAREGAAWGLPELAMVDGWFESLRPVLPEPGAAAARALPALSIGLHADLMISNGLGEPGSPATLAELSRQADRFVELVGRAPTHVDSHHNLHRDPRVLPALLEIAKRLGVPLRGHSAVRYLSSFYGQWSGESHPEQISVANLLHILASEIDGGIVELGCHPGYPDP